MSISHSAPLRSFICFQMNPSERCLSSSPCSPVSRCARPLLTSTLLEQDKPSMPSIPSPPPSPEDSVNHGSFYGFSKVSPVSWVSSSQSSVRTSRVKTSPTTSLAGPCKREVGPGHTSCFVIDWLELDG